MIIARNEVATKKYKKTDDNSHSGQTARLEQKIETLHRERTTIKDFITEITRLENIKNFNDTKMMNALGIMVKCDETSPHYDKLHKMYDDALHEKTLATTLLQQKKDSYEQYQASLVFEKDGALKTPREISFNRSESISEIDNTNLRDIDDASDDGDNDDMDDINDDDNEIPHEM